jgi:alpha-maltose-1-phosphate synthase
LSSWAERTAYEAADAVIAVSAASRTDVLAAYPALDESRVHVVHNGIDTDVYRPDPDVDVLARLDVDPDRPIVAFVGRITRQKGVPHLLRAALAFDPAAQLVLLAGTADTPELAAETDAAVAALRAARDGVHWIVDVLSRADVRQVLSHATMFVCPSIYEPLGIVNLEAMACATAVVASDVGGIPEVVADGTTGLLVHFDPTDAATYEADLADAVNRLLGDPDLAARMGAAGRQRAIAEFGWDAIARTTLSIYESLGASR